MTHSAMTVRIYQINAETGERVTTAEKHTLAGVPTAPIGTRLWPPCECPQHR